MPRPRKRILANVVSSPGSTQVCFSACNTEKLAGSGLERRLTNDYNECCVNKSNMRPCPFIHSLSQLSLVLWILVYQTGVSSLSLYHCKWGTKLHSGEGIVLSVVVLLCNSCLTVSTASSYMMNSGEGIVLSVPRLKIRILLIFIQTLALGLQVCLSKRMYFLS